MQCVGEGGVAAAHASNGEGAVFANDIIRALLVARRRVAIVEVVTGRPWSPATPARSNNVRGGRVSRPIWTSLGVKLVAALTEFVEPGLNMTVLFIPVSWELAEDHRQSGVIV